jgi:hypothetical protein
MTIESTRNHGNIKSPVVLKRVDVVVVVRCGDVSGLRLKEER